MQMPSIGLSASDFEAARGHLDATIYEYLDHIEYGGYSPPRTDPGLQRFRERFPDLPIGRHLVSTDLPAPLDIPYEVHCIRADLEGEKVAYLVTDFGYWRLGGRGLGSLWFRPCALTRAAAKRITHNVCALQDALGLPFYPENPFVVYTKGELDIADFMSELAAGGIELCLDIGHFVAWYHNRRMDYEDAFARLPFEAIRMAHVAGLCITEYGGQPLFMDNHIVPPSEECLILCQRLRARRVLLRWLTYEAEMAATEVQMAGLLALRKGVP